MRFKLAPACAMILAVEEESLAYPTRYWHLNATFAEVKPDFHLRKPSRQPHTSAQEDLLGALEHFQISSQNSADQVAAYNVAEQRYEYGEARSYAWHARYRTRSFIELHDAEGIVLVLRTFEREMEKLKAQLGPPSRLSDYIVRAARVFGLARFVIPMPNGIISPETNQPWRIGDATSAKGFIDSAEQQFISEIRKRRSVA